MGQSRRNRYLELLSWGDRLFGNEAGANMICHPPAGNSGRGPDFMAYWQWAMYEMNQDARHAELAKRLVAGPRKKWMADNTYHRQAALMDEFCHYPFGWVYTNLRDKGMLSKDEDGAACDFLEGSLRFWQEYPSFFCGSTELDIGNLGITPACGADYASRYIFKGEFGKSLRAWADKVWNDYWAVGDCGEDATNYEPLHFVFMPLWAKIRGQMKTLQKYVTHSYERIFQQILPMGAPIDQGDSFWMSCWDGWIATFEIAARITRDGRYAWAAQRLMDYLLASGYQIALEEGAARLKTGEAQFSSKFTGLGDVGLPQSMFFVTVAAQWADETVLPAEPGDHNSRVTYRYRVSLPEAWDTCLLGGISAGMTMFPHGQGDRHEDKLVLRGGYQADANCLIASLDQSAYHDHADSGAILAWVDKGAVLLHGSGYTQRRLNSHNVLYCRPRTSDVQVELGTTFFHRGEDFPRNRCTMDFVEDMSVAALARYKSTHLSGLDAQWRRTLIFARDGAFLAVLDEIESRSDDLWAAPLWHAQNVYAQGDNWADTDQGELWNFPNITWSRQTRRLLVAAPLGLLRRIRQDNPDLEDRHTQTRQDRLRMWGQQECLCQLAGVDRGGQGWFLSVLVPHEPGVPGEKVASGIRVLANEPSAALPPGSPPAWCIEITDEREVRHILGMVPPRMPVFYNVPRPDHIDYTPSWTKKVDVGDPHADRSQWLSVTDGGKTVITTDAEIFYLRKQGRRSDLAVRHMRNLEMEGLKHHADISPCWPPTRFQVNGEFTVDPQSTRAFYSCRNFNPIELTLGFEPSRLNVSGGVNGLASKAELAGAKINLALNGIAEVIAHR
jgi:hypothetical protein